MDNIVKNYTYFSKDVMVFEEGDKLVAPPAFVKRARTRYRYDHSRHFLQKKCKDCEVFHDVQLFENGNFRDVHNEECIHFAGEISGYGVRCKECEQHYEMNKRDDLEDVVAVEPKVISVIEQKELHLNGELYLHLSVKNLEFVNVVAHLKGVTVEVLVNELLDKVRVFNQYSVNYEENL